MNWMAFIAAFWVGLVLEVGPVNALRIGGGSVAPSVLVPLVAYIALAASRQQALWAALIVGVAMDLAWVVPRGEAGDAVLVGPHALGLLLAARLVLAARRKVMPRHPVTLAFMSMMSMAVAQTVVVVMISIRAAYDGMDGWAPLGQFGARLLSSLYTGLLAIPLAMVLHRTDRLWGFAPERGRRRF